MDKFIEALTRADQAMQDAQQHCPPRKLAIEVTQGTFESVRATLVMAQELQQEEKRNEERQGR